MKKVLGAFVVLVIAVVGVIMRDYKHDQEAYSWNAWKGKEVQCMHPRTSDSSDVLVATGIAVQLVGSGDNFQYVLKDSVVWRKSDNIKITMGNTQFPYFSCVRVGNQEDIDRRNDFFIQNGLSLSLQ